MYLSTPCLLIYTLFRNTLFDYLKWLIYITTQGGTIEATDGTQFPPTNHSTPPPFIWNMGRTQKSI